MTAVVAYVGLGSNLDHPLRQLRNALSALSALDGARLLRHSRPYRSAPWGMLDQPDFFNAVAELQTALPAPQVLDALLSIERAFGRRRDGARWGPRVIDLDLLLYGNHTIRQPGLGVPHPRMAERAFALLPLAELDARIEIPGYGAAGDLLARIDAGACTPLSFDRD